VDWGDGTTHSTFSQVTTGSLGTRPHTYAEEGAKTVTVTVTNGVSQADTKTFTVNVADRALSPSGATVNGSENVGLTNVVVATFIDLGGAEPLGDYGASIDWGDGNVSSGTVQSNGAGGFRVLGSNTYAEEGTYPITVTISHDSAGSFTANSTANVADADLTATGTPLNETTGVPFVDTVATFTDANPVLDLGDFSAVVDWGDGSGPLPEPVSQSGTTFSVANDGTFSYASAGIYTVTVTITDAGGSSISTTSTITVTDPAPDPSGGGGQGGPGSFRFRAGNVLPGDPLVGVGAGRDWAHGGLGGPAASAVPEGDEALRAAPSVEQRAARAAGLAVAMKPKEGHASDAFWAALGQPSWDRSAVPESWVVL
jgi:PKD repeat protein